MRQKIDLKAAVANASAPVAVAMTFGELSRAYSATRFDGIDLRLRKWVELFGTVSAWEVPQHEIEAAAEAMVQHGYKTSTVNRDISAIGQLYKWAKKKRLCPAGFVSPTLELPRFEEVARVVTLAPDEVAKLLAGAHSFSDRRFAAFVALLHDTGCRKGEVLARRWSDIDLEKREILVEVTKTGRPRVLFFTEATAALLRRCWPKRNPDAMLFEGRVKGQPINYRRQWGELCAAIGRPDLHMHDMRHHRAAELLRSGVTVAVAAQVLGHSSNILQSRYGHLETGHLREAMATSWKAAA